MLELMLTAPMAFGAVRQVADHYGVDDAHRHPPDLGKHKRQGETQGWAQFDTECLQSEHNL